MRSSGFQLRGSSSKTLSDGMLRSLRLKRTRRIESLVAHGTRLALCPSMRLERMAAM